MKIWLKWLLCILIVVGGAVSARMIYYRISAGSKGKTGGILFDDLPLIKIKSVSIHSTLDKVELIRKNGNWVVASRFDYPANIGKIRVLMQDIVDSRVGHVFPVRDDIRRRLRLRLAADHQKDEDESGIRVLLKGSSGNIFADILFGKERSLAEGAIPNSRYLMLGDSEVVCLVNNSFSVLEKNSSDWLNLPVIEEAAENVKKIECFEHNRNEMPVFIFEREGVGTKLLPKKKANAVKVDAAVVDKLTWALAYLPMEDILLPSDDTAALAYSSAIRLDYYLYNGLIYRIYPGSFCSDGGGTTSCYIKIEVDYQLEVAEEPIDAAKESVKALNDTLGDWIYKISSGHHSNFITETDQLLADIN